MKVRFDAVALHATVHELSQRLVGGRLRRIQQFGPELFLFTVFRPRGVGESGAFEGPETRFLVCLASGAARIHLAERAYGAADTPTSFCMLARKHLEGARITALTTDGLERVVRLEVASHPEGEAGSLAICLLPNLRTLVLLDRADRVLGEMRHTLRKGTVLSLPTPPRPHAIRLCGREAVEALRSLEPTVSLAKGLTQISFGLGIAHGREIAVRAGLDPNAPFDGSAHDALASAWDRFGEALRSGEGAPVAVDVDASERLLLPFSFLSLAQAPTVAYASMSRMTEEAFADTLGEPALAAMRATLLAALARQRTRTVRRIGAQENDLEAATGFDTWRLYGDLIMASLHRIRPRATEVEVEDYTQEGAPRVRIALDPDLTAAENARAYYEQYKKARRGVAVIREVIDRSRLALDYLDTLVSAVETAAERDDLREIEAQMIAERLLGGVVRKRPKGPASRPRRYAVSGWDILVGRNPQQNELLTLRMARPEDWWLHARQIPGAHVLIRSQGNATAPPDDVLIAAARLAAGFSKAAQSGRVAVDWTRVRYVKKPPGTPAGYVTYSREKTIDAAPATDLGVSAEGETGGSEL